MLKYLTSMKTAVTLMVLIIIISILATFFPEIGVYKSIWYRSILVFFCLNLLFCTIKTFPKAYQNLNISPSIPKKKQRLCEKVKLNKSKQAEKNIFQHLKQQGYKLKTTTDGNDTAVIAHKGLVNYFAPHVLHTTLIIVFIGALVSSFGVSKNIPCYVGQTMEIPNDLIEGTYLKVKDFKTVYDQEGNIENWVSQISLFKNKKSVVQGKIQVNQPFVYKGVKFYQSGYGTDHLISIKGKGEFSIPTDKPIGITANQGLLVKSSNDGYKMKFYDGNQLVKTVPLHKGKIISFKGTKVEYKKQQDYSILTVKRNPGTILVMFGFACVTVASLLFWTKRYHRVYLAFNHQDSYMQFKVFSKDDTVEQQVKENIITKL